MRIGGWILSGLVGVFMIGLSSYGKFFDFPGKAAMFEKLGFSYELMRNIGVLEIAVTVIFLIPRSGFIGAILLTGYLGGAVVTHVRVHDPIFECSFPIVIGVLVWLAMALRRPEIFALALGNPVRPKPSANASQT